jgi:serine/threonine-protein kinase
VYSLGVVLYEMLAGRPPFTGDTPVGVAAQHVQRRPPPLGELASNVPLHVVAACEQALAKDPAARPASAAAFAAMLLSPEGAAPATATPVRTAAPGGPATTLDLPPVEPTAVLGGQPPTARRPRPNRLAPWIIAGVLVALLALALALLSTAGDKSPSPPPPSPTKSGVAVPNVVGMKLDEAKSHLEDQGFQVSEVPVQGKHDVVARTDPPPDTLAAPGSTVTLYVGSEPEDRGKGKGKGSGGDD